MSAPSMQQQEESKHAQRGRRQRLGLDAGGVLFVHRRHLLNNEDTSSTQWMDGCLDVLPLLAAKYDLYVVSFAGKRVGAETSAEIARAAGQWIPADRVVIVRDRAHKANECKRLELDGFVDDQEHILQNIHRALPDVTLIHFAEDATRPRGGVKHVVCSWDNLRRVLLADA